MKPSRKCTTIDYYEILIIMAKTKFSWSLRAPINTTCQLCSTHFFVAYRRDFFRVVIVIYYTVLYNEREVMNLAGHFSFQRLFVDNFFDI